MAVDLIPASLRRRRRIRAPVCLGLLALLVASCAGPASFDSQPTAPDSQTLTVFAAASLLDAFTEIGRSFEAAHPGVAVLFNFDGSQSLRAQIEQGAAADVFAPADRKEMDALSARSLIAETRPHTFVTNRLVVILPAQNPAGIQSLADLSRSGVMLVLAAGDVPVGGYSRQALENLDAQFGPDYSAQVLSNVVSNEDNVRQIVAKVQLGEADAGIVYASDAVAAPDLATLSIPPEYNVDADYPIAVLADAPHPDLAAGFVAWVLSPDGQAILQKWGFGPAKP